MARDCLADQSVLLWCWWSASALGRPPLCFYLVVLCAGPSWEPNSSFVTILYGKVSMGPGVRSKVRLIEAKVEWWLPGAGGLG